MQKYRTNGLFLTPEVAKDLLRILQTLEPTPFTGEQAKGLPVFRVAEPDDWDLKPLVLTEDDVFPAAGAAPRIYEFERKRVCFDIWMCRGIED